MRNVFRNSVFGATFVALALVAAACGSGEDATGTTAAPTTTAAGETTTTVAANLPPVVIGSTNFGEQLILGEIYAQALENAGIAVERKFNLGTREIVKPALDAGEIDLLAEYTGSLLTYLGGTSSPDSDTTYQDLQAALGPDLEALAYSPAQDKNGIVVTADTAARLNLSKVSDLAAYNGELVFGGPPECPDREFCLKGLEDVYGLSFKEFKPLDVGGPITVTALEGGEIDVALLFTSDGVIAAKGFVLLEDDKNLQPAENIVPVLRTNVADAYGGLIAQVLDPVSARITTAELSDLNRRYGIDAEDPETVAKDWLESAGF